MRLPIDVDPELYSAASAVFGQSMAEEIHTIWSKLTGTLNGCGGMAGDDPGGTSWAQQYDPAAQATVAVIGDLAGACTQIAALLEQTGFNHGIAESASDPTRVVATPPDRTRYVAPAGTGMVCIAGHDVPLARGGSGSAPSGWGILEHAIGYVWPNGDPGKLRAAASAWSSAAENLSAVAGYVPEAVESIQAQTSPEVDDAVTVCQSMSTHLSDVAAECTQLGHACTALAGHIDSAHRAIEDEITSFLEWTAGIEAAGFLGSFFTFGGAEAAAQAAEAARIAETGGRIAEIIRTLITAARTVAETVGAVVGRVGSVAERLKVILGARLSYVSTELAARLPGFGKDAEALATDGLEEGARIASYDFGTARDEAYFWSGRTDGVGGADVAGRHAGDGGGTTLEQLMERRGIKMPEWNPDDPASIKAWNEASELYAKGASGTVHAVIGQSMRADATWLKYELPALKANPAVTRIIQIDPATGVQKLIWSR